MDDLYCPDCRLVLYRRRLGQVVSENCPRCASRGRRVRLLALDQLPSTPAGGGDVARRGREVPAGFAEPARRSSRDA